MLKSRKKILLSSIAMLLVALVALGSATFAWYTTQKSVSASTTKLNATAANGLVIRKTTSDTWAKSISNLLGSSASQEVSPATINYGAKRDVVTGGYGTGKDADDGTLSGSLTGVSNANLESSTSYFLLDDFWVASTGTQRTDVKIKAIGSTIANSYMNVAVYVDEVYMGTISSEDASTNNIIADPATTETLYPVSVAGNTFKTGVTIKSNQNNANGSHVQLIGFADGENPMCKNSTQNLSEFAVTWEFYYD
jgi:hypothetical protein